VNAGFAGAVHFAAAAIWLAIVAAGLTVVDYVGFAGVVVAVDSLDAEVTAVDFVARKR
jgi:hypothetical protein